MAAQHAPHSVFYSRDMLYTGVETGMFLSLYLLQAFTVRTWVDKDHFHIEHNDLHVSARKVIYTAFALF